MNNKQDDKEAPCPECGKMNHHKSGLYWLIVPDLNAENIGPFCTVKCRREYNTKVRV